jgi:hypothetical protein
LYKDAHLPVSAT